MADKIVEQVLTGPVRTPTLTWPQGEEKLRLTLLDTAFLPGTAVRLTIEISWDRGDTFPFTDVTEWPGGAKSARTGGAPYVQLAFRHPTRRHPEGEPNPGTHYRLTLEPIQGLPVVGVR